MTFIIINYNYSFLYKLDLALKTDIKRKWLKKVEKAGWKRFIWILL